MRKIIWQWWTNPLGGGPEWTDEAKQRPPKRNKRFYEEEEATTPPNIRAVAATSIGLLPLDVYGDLSKNVNLWIGNANFTIDEPILEAIEDVEGVEFLDILTRYRFRIGFGLCFDAKEVRARIEAILGITEPEPPRVMDLDAETLARVEAIREVAVAKKYPFWAILVLPNGKIDFTHGENRTAFEATLGTYEEAAEATGGVVFTFDDR